MYTVLCLKCFGTKVHNNLQAFAVGWQIIVDSTQNSASQFLTYVTVRANWVHNPTYGGTVALYCTSRYYCYLLHQVHNTGLFTDASKIHAVHHSTTAMVQYVLWNHRDEDFMAQYTIIPTGRQTYRNPGSAVIFFQTLFDSADTWDLRNSFLFLHGS